MRLYILKIFLWFTVFTAVVLTSRAQYSGGNGDGVGYNIHSCPSALIYTGGSYDGVSYVTVFCWNGPVARYTGGLYDGVSGQNQSPCTPVANLGVGGSYDGFCLASTSANCVPGIYAGGSYDGTSIATTTGCNPTNIAAGGSYDGTSVASSTCTTTYNLYVGGSYDGFADTISGCSAVNLYVGGSYDGTGYQAVSCSAPIDICTGGSYDGTGYTISSCGNTNIYTGGSYDGVSYVVQSCATPPNVFAGGSYDGTSLANSGACATSNVYAGGSYDGTSVASNGACTTTNVYVGGSYDGFSLANSGSCPSSNPYVGGSYDGVSYALTTCTTVNADLGGSNTGPAYAKVGCPGGNIYAGGNYDGVGDVIVFCSSSQTAQYTGGPYDGVSGLNSACPTTPTNVAYGGSYDGTSLASVGVCNPGIYVGGTYDGASIASLNSCTNYNLYTGGSYDGVSYATTPACTATNICLGGSYDGTGYTLTACTSYNVFKGGSYDGVAYAVNGVCATSSVYVGGSYDGTSTASFSNCTITNFYAGGPYDGTSIASSSCTSTGPYKGGSYDGTSIASSNCSTPSNIYAGGSYDGFSLMQLSCAPTASIYKGGSYDGVAYSLYNCTPVNLYVGGAYDGFGYKVTLCCTPPTVTQQPVSDSVCAGATAVFALSGSSISGIISYQWQENRGSGWNNITSAGGVYGNPDTTALILTGVPRSMSGYTYRCLLSVACGAFTYSNIDTLTVDQVNAAPPTENICAGTSININGNPSGGTGSFVSNAWSIDSAGTTGVTSTNLVNANQQTLTFNSSGLSAGRVLLTYVVTDRKGCNATVIDTVNVNAIPAIINFNIDTIVSCQGYPATAHVFSSSMQNGTYQVTYSITGNNTASGTATMVFTNNQGYFTTSTLANSGTTKIKVTSVQIVLTGCNATINTDSLVFNVGTAPAITAYSPASFINTVCAGSNTYFELTTTGAYLNYIWQYSPNNGISWNGIADTGAYTGSSTSTLNIVSNASLDGYKYRAILNGECAPPDTSMAGVLHVGSVSIVTQPAATLYGCVGDTTVLSIYAQGTNLGYKWQYSSNGGSTWANLSNGATYSGVSTDSLIIITQSGYAGYLYRCVVNTIACNPDTSTSSVMSLTSAPSITLYTPASFADTVCSGTSANFSLTTSGSGLVYQWQVSSNSGSSWSNLSNSGGYSGVFTSSLSITTVPSMDGNQYRCVINGACAPADTSLPGTLTVGAISISTQPPVNTNICSGTNGTIAVSVSGNHMNYQWQVYNGTTWSNLSNNATYSNVTTSTLGITNATSAINGYQYRCIISTLVCTSVTSTASTVNIYIAPSITSTQHNQTICVGSNTAFTVTATGTPAPTYQWMFNGSNISGATSATYNVTSATNANAGIYGVIVSNACASDTVYDTLTVIAAPAITAYSPTSFIDTACAASTATFSITTTGGGLTYQWQVSTNSGSTWSNVSNGATYSGVTTTSLSIVTVAGLDGYYYRCVVTSSVCSSTLYSNPGILRVGAVNISTQPASSTSICNGLSGTIGVTATGNYLLYQWQLSTNSGSTWTSLTNNSVYNNVTTNTLGVTAVSIGLNGYQYRCVISTIACVGDTSNVSTLTINTSPTVTSYTPSTLNDTVCATGTTTLSITATGTALTYQWQVSTNSGGSYSAISNNATYSGATTNTLSIVSASSMDGYYYRCVVSGTCAPSQTSSAFILHVGTVSITTQPAVSPAICNGATGTISLAASGTYLGYQWQLSTNGGSSWSNITNAAPYSGATTNTLTLTAVTTALNGYQYRCMVSTVYCSSQTSNVSTLTINLLPAVTSYTPTTLSDTVCAGSTATFAITATGTGITYQWQVSSNGGSTYGNVTNGATYSGATTNTLNVVTTAAMNNYLYRCVVSGTCPPAATSNAFTLHVGAVSISVQPPTSVSYCTGNSGSIGLTVSGNYLSYQWLVSADGGTTWSVVTNGSSYTGATTNSLGVTNITSGMGGYQYKVVVSTLVCPNDTSNVTLLGIAPSPSISAYNPSPFNNSVCAGSNALFAITAANANAFQWQLSTNSGSTWSVLSNGGVYSGVSTDSLSITAATASMDGYYYRCIVQGNCLPYDTSLTGILYVGAVGISTQPSPAVSICNTLSGTISLAATGTHLTYQWQVSTNSGSSWSSLTNTAPYSGVTTSVLGLTSVTTALNGNQYRCVVSTIVCPADTSNTSTLTINTPPAITAYAPASLIDSVCAGSTATFGLTATGTALTYQWQVSTNSGGSWSVISNGATYSGVSTATLNIVTTAAMNTYWYRCVVSGTCSPTQTSSTFVLKVGSVSISTQPPSSISLCSGSNGSVTVTAAGNYLSYQWQLSTNSGTSWSNISNSAPYSGATTTTLGLTGVTLTMNSYQYRCVISSIVCVGDTSSTTSLTVNPAPVITAYSPASFMDTICAGSNATFGITASNATGYQWIVSTNSGISWANVSNNATYSGATTNSLNITAAVSGMDGYYYRCIATDACLPYDTSSTGILYVGSVTINSQPASAITICSGSNTTMTLAASGNHLTYQWQVSTNSGGSWSNISNNTTYSGATTNSMSITAAASTMTGYLYRNVVSTWACAGDTSSITTLTVNVAPSIVTPPVSQTVCNNSPVTFSVTATGTPNPTYQWYYNGSAISGATSSSYVISSATSANAGNYNVTVTNSCGTVTSPSSPAVLAINYPPSISAYTPISFTETVCSGTNTTFAVTASGNGLIYHWQVSNNGGTSWSTLSNNSTYSGTTNSTLTITTNRTLDGNNYRVVVTGFCTPADTSNPGTLNVGFDSIAVQPPATTTVCNNSTGTIGITAVGTHLGYQWQLSTNNGISWTNIPNNATYSNATTATLGLSGVTTAMNGYRYRCVVNTIVCTADTTTSSTLSILMPPSITSYSPVTFVNNICNLSNTYFTVTGSGAGLSYQWQVSADSGAHWSNVTNSSVYSGAQTNNLGITTSTSLDGYRYRVILNGTCSPPDTSSAGILNVGAIAITQQPPTTTPVCVNGTVGVQTTVTGTHLSYEWQVSSNGGSTWSNVTNGSNYSGATTNLLGILNFTSAMNGYDYRVIVSTTACSPDTSTVSTLVTSSSLTAIAALAGCMFEDSAHINTAVDSNLVLVTITGGTPPYSISTPTIGQLRDNISDSLVEYTIPANNASYTYTITDNSGCVTRSNNVTSFSANPTTIPYTSTHGSENAVCYDNGFMKWLTFVDTANKAILAVYDSSSNLGQLTVTVYKDSVTPQILDIDGCAGFYAAAMQRHFVLSSTAPQPFSHLVSIRLFFTEPELDSLEVASQANNTSNILCSESDDVYSINDLYVTKYDDPRTGHPTENGIYSDNLSQAAGGIYKVYGTSKGSNTNLYGPLAKDSLGFSVIYPNGQALHYVQFNVTEFSELWLHGSQFQVSPLPVEMLYLEAEAIDNSYIQVRWATALEINNNHFVVERSTDAQNWDSIGVVAGHDNTTVESDYRYNDMNVIPNVRYYYRLKQVDNNGNIKITDVVTAMIYSKGIFSIKGFVPNPNTGSTKLILTSSYGDEISVDFYDALGQKLMSTRQNITPGGNTIDFDLSRFASGVYTAVISGSSGTYSSKLVITR